MRPWLCVLPNLVDIYENGKQIPFIFGLSIMAEASVVDAWYMAEKGSENAAAFRAFGSQQAPEKVGTASATTEDGGTGVAVAPQKRLALGAELLADWKRLGLGTKILAVVMTIILLMVFVEWLVVFVFSR
jgi:hypothetical protein